MKTDLRDGFSYAAGRVYSAATVEAAHGLDWRRRLQVRRLVHRGQLPDDPPSRAYAMALARDLDRMRPRQCDGRPYWLIAWPLLFLSATLGSDWFFAGVIVAAGSGMALVAWAQRRDRTTLRAVVIDGYELLSGDERVAFNHAVREPLRLGRGPLVVGAVIHGLLCVAYGGVLGVAIAADGDLRSIDASVAVLAALMAAVLIGTAAGSRRRFLRELREEPRPQMPPPVSAVTS